FRSTEEELPSLAIGSLATIYLGLGVLAANAAHHDRTAGRGRLQSHHMAQAGGLVWQDLAFLLAVQATVRDDVLEALDTLYPSQAELVQTWRDVLDDHELELVALLALGDLDREAAPLRTEPRAAIVRADVAETDLERANLGRPVFRMPGG